MATREWSLAKRKITPMFQSLNLAQANAWALAQTLMLPVLLLTTDTAEFGIMPANEYDGDAERILAEYEPVYH